MLLAGLTLVPAVVSLLVFFSSRRRHTRCGRDWSSDVCSSDLEGEVTQAIEPPGRGLVFVSGELWRATAQEPVRKGARVRVVKVDGLTLLVEPTEPASRPPG